MAVSRHTCGRIERGDQEIETHNLTNLLWGPLQVNAIVGGVLANEVLKAVSGRGEPLDNLFMYRCAADASISLAGNCKILH